MIRLLAIALLLSSQALARDDGRWAQADPKMKNWFKDQKIPGGQGRGTPCCNESDGTFAEEWMKDGRYYTRWAEHPEWMLVPEEVVIYGPNYHGSPVVWWTKTYSNGVRTSVSIRCYVPGAGF